MTDDTLQPTLPFPDGSLPRTPAHEALVTEYFTLLQGLDALESRLEVVVSQLGGTLIHDGRQT